MAAGRSDPATVQGPTFTGRLTSGMTLWSAGPKLGLRGTSHEQIDLVETEVRHTWKARRVDGGGDPGGRRLKLDACGGR